MYSTCLFCRRSLGANDHVESFPVGRRLAFDSAAGRLWVVCVRCGRWNLSALEERWEALEACERLFSGTRTRIATTHIGMAELRDGFSLVRVGRALRPEFAGWRYGRRLARRRSWNQLVTAGRMAGAAVASLGSLVVAVDARAWVSVGGRDSEVRSRVRAIPEMFRHAMLGNPRDLVTRLQVRDGRVVDVRRHHVWEMQILPHVSRAGPRLVVPHVGGKAVLTGDRAVRAAGLLVPHLNRFGGSPSEVEFATSYADRRGAAPAFASAVHAARSAGLYRVSTLSSFYRLALEMACNEESERQALEGEMEALRAEWERAEEIAAVADRLVLPAAVERGMARLRGAG